MVWKFSLKCMKSVPWRCPPLRSLLPSLLSAGVGPGPTGRLLAFPHPNAAVPGEVLTRLTIPTPVHWRAATAELDESRVLVPSQSSVLVQDFPQDPLLDSRLFAGGNRQKGNCQQLFGRWGEAAP